MGIFRKSKGVASGLIDVRVDRWMGLSFIKDTTNNLRDMVVDSITPDKAQRTETFEEAMQRLELTEKDLDQRRMEFRRLVTVFIIIALCIIAYGFYLAIKGSIFPALITLALAIFCLTQAFKYHFWLFQIKHRKLGCTLKEWFNDKTIEESTDEEKR